ncbi:MAG: carbohydrate binding family 9 domain-containing protein, partial [Prolixibacteraceae bacterium]|nr:carbohydrate binding family 9 domain-containing protein [Prolixibacteraceae bacterium]
MIKNKIFIVSVLSVLFLFQAKGQNNDENKIARSYNLKAAVGNIIVDGNLNEESWSNVESTSDFKMSFPVDDRLAEQANQTHVKLTYDNQFLYIGAICFGPDNYIIQTLKRDNTLQAGDAFGIVIDPVNERTNGFVFGVNPMGVQTEMLVSGQTGRREILEPGRTPRGVNIAWDNKWYSEVKRYDDRWEIEIAIPFKTLRFDDGKTTWGINFFRIDAQSNSIHTWEPVPLEFPEIDLGYAGQLNWDNPPQKVKSNISLIPYVLSGISRDIENNTPNKTEFQTGIDGKVALTSSLNFDLTINPNFSQVEIDEQVTNLSLFNVRLPEKRLFFLENSDVFEDFGIPPMKPFFSRRIGLDEDGSPIPILFGARVSGNINKDLRIGLMNMQTRKTNDFFAQNYTAFAFHQQVFSRSVIKGYLHNRQATNISYDDYNRNAGLEFLYRSEDGRFQNFAGYSKSFNPGENDENYFYNFGIGYDSKNISVYSNLAGVGVNYIADMGYFRGQEYYDAERDTVIRIGMHHWYSRWGYTIYANSHEKIISHEIGGRYSYDFGTDKTLLNSDLEVNYNLRFSNTSVVTAAITTTKINLLYPYSFTGDTPLPAGIYNYNSGEIGYESDQRDLFGFG